MTSDHNMELEHVWWDNFTGYCRQATASELGQEAVEMAELSETIGYWLRQHPWSRGDNNAWILHVADVAEDLAVMSLASFEFGESPGQLEVYKHSYLPHDIISLLGFITTNHSDARSTQTELGLYVPNHEDRLQFVKYGNMIMETTSTNIQSEGAS